MIQISFIKAHMNRNILYNSVAIFLSSEPFSETGYWLGVCHGWFHLQGLTRAVRNTFGARITEWKNSCPLWDSNPWPSAYNANTLPPSTKKHYSDSWSLHTPFYEKKWERWLHHRIVCLIAPCFLNMGYLFTFTLFYYTSLGLGSLMRVQYPQGAKCSL